MSKYFAAEDFGFRKPHTSLPPSLRLFYVTYTDCTKGHPPPLANFFFGPTFDLDFSRNARVKVQDVGEYIIAHAQY